MPRARVEVPQLENMVQTGKKKFVRYAEGAVLYSLGLHTFQEIASVDDYKDAEEQINECRQYTVEELFCCAYAPYFWQTIQIRYPEYATWRPETLLGLWELATFM